MDGKFTQVPSYGWRVKLDHVFPEKQNQMMKPKFHQMWPLIPLIFRYLWYCLTMWWKGRQPIMNFVKPLTSNQWSGVPLGGIGGGTIARSFRGEFCRFQMRPGFYDYNVVDANQFIVTVQNSEGKVIYHQVLSPLRGAKGRKLCAWKWGFPGDQAMYTALYPRAWTEYNIPEHGLKLTCRQVSPVIPHNYKDSCIPGGVFVWTVENTGSEAKSVSITCTLKNGVGDKTDRQGNCQSALFDFEDNGAKIDGALITQEFDNMQCTYCLSALIKEGVSVSRTPGFDPNSDGSSVWDDLARNGQLSSTSNGHRGGSEVACAVCAKVDILPRNVKSLEFALVWDMPKIHFQGKSKDYRRYYTKYFGADGKAGPAMSHYALMNFNRWDKEICAWQNPILDDLNLPEWYKSAIFNEVYFVADGGTVWLLMDDSEALTSSDPRREFGRFGYLEGHEYRMYNTYDVHFYASFTLVQLWPKLQACLQYDFRDTVLRAEIDQRKHLFTGKVGNRKDLNAIPHDLGDPGRVQADFTLDVPHNDVKLRLYAADDSYAVWTLGEAEALFSDKGYNSTRDLIMIILGYDKEQDIMIQQTVKALLSRKLDKDYNIVAVDLPEQFSLNAKNLYYLRPAMNVPSAGQALGEYINAAIDKEYITADKINIISFSLGAQIAGYMGRKVNGLLNSITGVDPAGIGFDWSTLLTRLIHVSHEDAKFVHLYHSNSALLGTTLRLGTADYLFNDGEMQPNCPTFLDPMCSHLRGFLYYVEALRSFPGLPALQCNSHRHLVHCKCRGNRLSFVGFPLDTRASGLFVLRLRDEPPFSLGKDGVAGTRCRREKSEYSYRMGLHYDKLMKMLKKK